MADNDNYDCRTQTFAINEQLQAEVQKLVDEGWEIMPGTIPVAVYQLRRARGDRFGARGGLTIDEDKFYVVGPDGKRKD